MFLAGQVFSLSTTVKKNFLAQFTRTFLFVLCKYKATFPSLDQMIANYTEDELQESLGKETEFPQFHLLYLQKFKKYILYTLF